MLDRNRRIKSKPERFQKTKDKFDIIVTCEERVYDQVIDGENISYKPNWISKLFVPEFPYPYLDNFWKLIFLI